MTITSPLAPRHGWRLLLASGVILFAGGPMHPESDAKDPLRRELATMTADPAWVPGHAMIVVGTLLFAAALWLALRGRAWPASLTTPLRVAAIAFSLYAVETVAHLAAAADAHALAHGEPAPIAMTHMGLALVLYPVAGLALAWLALNLGRAWRGPRRAIAGIGIVAGLLHATSVPATLLLPETELSPMFAGATILLAVFSVLTAAAGAPRAASVAPVRRKAAVGV